MSAIQGQRGEIGCNQAAFGWREEDERGGGQRWATVGHARSPSRLPLGRSFTPTAQSARAANQCVYEAKQPLQVARSAKSKCVGATLGSGPEWAAHELSAGARSSPTRSSPLPAVPAEAFPPWTSGRGGGGSPASTDRRANLFAVRGNQRDEPNLPGPQSVSHRSPTRPTLTTSRPAFDMLLPATFVTLLTSTLALAVSA